MIVMMDGWEGFGMKGNYILLLTSDESLRKKMRYQFRVAGFRVILASSMEEGMELLQVKKPLAILAEMKSNEMDGMELCRYLRYEEKNWIPLILLAEQFQEFDAVLALELGADAYYGKPLREKKIVAKTKAIIRRGQVGLGEGEVKEVLKQKKNQRVSIGEIDIFPDSFTVYYKKEPIELTQKEFELLLFLYENRGKAVSRKKLLTAIRGYEENGDYRIIDVFINRLRSKLEPKQGEPKYIKTVRNVGYMLQDKASKLIGLSWIIII